MRWWICIFLLPARLAFAGDETWQAALGRMPLGSRVPELIRTNCVAVMLHAFQSNDVV